MIRVLIADDSETTVLMLRSILEREPDIEVVGQAGNGEEAVRLARLLKPDLITMDIHMPVMDGLEATRNIMALQPTPIVVVSTRINGDNAGTNFRALDEGALAVMEKPGALAEQDYPGSHRELVDTIRAMACLRVMRRISSQASIKPGPVSPLRTGVCHKAMELVAIGCSTGGPQALEVILGGLPGEFPLPIVIVQHISVGYMTGMIDWLQQSVQLELRLAEHGQKLSPGVAYFAPDEYHLTIERNERYLVSALNKDEPVNRFRPSSTPLLESVALACPGSALGVVLTGMGDDGAEGLLRMRQAGCHTIVQDRESAVVYGMPGAALGLEAVDRVVQLENMAGYLNALVSRHAVAVK